MMEYRLTITISEHGRSEENGARLLEGVLAKHPEVGPVVSQSLAAGTLSVTFSLEAEDPQDGFEHGWSIFVAGANASGLEPTEVVDVRITQVPAEELEEERELELA
jgi:hypothetical protein